MARSTIRSLVLVTLLLVSAASVGVAGASEQHTPDDADREYSTQTNTTASAHLNVHAQTDGDQLVVTVDYDGNGSALVTIEGTDAAYQDGGSYEVENERTFRLSKPQHPAGISIDVETPHVEYTRTVEYEQVTIGCGEAAVEANLPATMTTHTLNDTDTADIFNLSVSTSADTDGTVTDSEDTVTDTLNDSDDTLDGDLNAYESLQPARGSVDGAGRSVLGAMAVSVAVPVGRLSVRRWLENVLFE